MHDTKTVHSIHSMLPLIIVNGADSMRIVAIVSLLWASTALAQPEIEGSQVFILVSGMRTVVFVVFVYVLLG
jgi:hypothetical protein